MNGIRRGSTALLLTMLLLALTASPVFGDHKPNHGNHGHGKNEGPTVSITSPENLDAFAGGALVAFEGTASDAEDGDISAGLVWASSIDIDGQIGIGGTVSATLSDGNHTITAAVTDSDGNTGIASIIITVWTPPPGVLTVGVVSIDYVPVGDKKVSVTFVVKVDLEEGVPVTVPGAAVTATLFRNGKEKDTDTFTTGPDGTVTVDGGSGPPGTYTIEINDVVAYGLDWDGVTPANSYTQ